VVVLPISDGLLRTFFAPPLMKHLPFSLVQLEPFLLVPFRSCCCQSAMAWC